MTFVLDSAIGLGVWLPFTIGKSTALLTVGHSALLHAAMHTHTQSTVKSPPIPSNHSLAHPSYAHRY